MNGLLLSSLDSLKYHPNLVLFLHSSNSVPLIGFKDNISLFSLSTCNG